MYESATIAAADDKLNGFCITSPLEEIVRPFAPTLLESFQQSRSTAWYWRQVFIAILVEASGKLRVRSPQIVIACASTLLLHLSPWIGQMSFVRFLWGRGLALPWPASGAYEFALGGLTNTLILLPFLVFMLRIRLRICVGKNARVAGTQFSATGNRRLDSDLVDYRIPRPPFTRMADLSG